MIITQTPLRISFVGGGTDLASFYEKEEGAVISSAIDKYVYVLVKQRFDDKIRVGYTRTEIVDSPDRVEHTLVREALKMTGVDRGIEIVTVGDVPGEGTGLGSSSSITVGLLNSLYQYQGTPRDPETLARQACEIEIQRLNKPIGKQDQYIAALGGFRKTVFHTDGRVSSVVLNINNSSLSNLGRNLMLFFSGITRSADNILRTQDGNAEKNLSTLRRMKGMVNELQTELEAGNIDALGEALHEGWRLKKQLAAGITNPQIEEIYERARAAGATGGKITGAGGGGFFLLYVPMQAQDRVRKALSHLKEVPFKLERDGTKTLLNVRRPE